MYSVGDFKYSTQSTDHDCWMVCDGRILLIGNYAQLYNVIGQNFGSMSSSTFQLPNCQGLTLAGVSQNHPVGQIVGEETHQLTSTELPSHSHTGTSDVAGSHNHGSVTQTDAGIHNHFGYTNGDTGAGPNPYLNIHTHDFPSQPNMLTDSATTPNGIIQQGSSPLLESYFVNRDSTTVGGYQTDNANSQHTHGILMDGYHNHFISNDGGHQHNFNTTLLNTTTEGHLNIQPTLYIGNVFIKYRE